MGLCRTCDRDAGWLSHECADCRAQREAAEKAKVDAEREAVEQERQARIQEMVEAAVNQLKATTDAGGTIWLYDHVILNLDDGWIDYLGMNRLRDLGGRGWAIVASTPHVRVSNGLQSAVTDVRFVRTQVVVGLAVSAANLGAARRGDSPVLRPAGRRRDRRSQDADRIACLSERF